jgi:AraC-like DNA-binding protein
VGVLLERLDRNEWPTHAHEHWQVTILFENAAWDISWRNVTGDSISRRIVGGQVWVIPPGWLHEVKSVGYGTAIVVYVTPAKLSAVQRLPTEALVASLTDFVTIDPLVAEMCRCLLSLYAAPSNGSLARIVGLGRLLALLIIEIAARNPSNNIGPPIGRAGQLVEKVRQLLEVSQRDELSVAALAKGVGISPRHFRRLFLQATGMTPQDYLWACRVEYGKALLKAGSHNVTQAAAAAGFADQTHMNRRFRAIYGVPPSTFLPRRPL